MELFTTIPELLSNDTFWSTIINYLTVSDLFNLKSCHPYYYDNINIKKKLSEHILNKLNRLYGDELIKSFLIDSDTLLTGKFINSLFKSCDQNCFNNSKTEFSIIIP